MYVIPDVAADGYSALVLVMLVVNREKRRERVTQLTRAKTRFVCDRTCHNRLVYFYH